MPPWKPFVEFCSASGAGLTVELAGYNTQQKGDRLAKVNIFVAGTISWDIR
jgi:hypothetical protein